MSAPKTGGMAPASGGAVASSTGGTDSTPSTGGTANTVDNDAGTDPYDPAFRCTPGDYVDGTSLSLKGFGSLYSEGCFGDNYYAALSAGIPDNGDKLFGIDSIELATPMTPGEPFAISREMSTNGMPNAVQYELWGSSGPCATDGTAELLATEILQVGAATYCHELSPQTMHTYLIVVVRELFDSGALTVVSDGITVCGGGSCP